MNIGSKIKLLRESAKMTQEELGSACGTTKQTIFKYETGIVTNIPLDRLERIADILGVTTAYLIGWEENEKPTPVAESGLSPDYDRLNAENKAFIDSMIEKLLKSQSDG